MRPGHTSLGRGQVMLAWVSLIFKLYFFIFGFGFSMGQFDFQSVFFYFWVRIGFLIQ